MTNGGLAQYFQNSYHTYRAPFDGQDTARLDKAAQEGMLQTLIGFAAEAFPERAADTARLAAVAADFAGSSYEEPAWSWDDEEDAEDWDDGLRAPCDFDSRFYATNEWLEYLMEAYAQFLAKRFGIGR